MQKPAEVSEGGAPSCVTAHVLITAVNKFTFRESSVLLRASVAYNGFYLSVAKGLCVR